MIDALMASQQLTKISLSHIPLSYPCLCVYSSRCGKDEYFSYQGAIINHKSASSASKMKNSKLGCPRQCMFTMGDIYDY